MAQPGDRRRLRDLYPGARRRCSADCRRAGKSRFGAVGGHLRRICGLRRQTFNTAGEKLDLALRDKTWTASTEQFEKGGYQNLPPAIMVNLDEGVWNNTPYERRLIERDGQFDYQKYSDWANEANCPAVPGAKQFLDHAARQNVAIIYLSPRGENMRDGTLRNLRRLEFPYDPEKDQLFLGEDWTNHHKREEVAQKDRILLIVSDYLGDFMHDAAKEPAQRREMAAKYADNWGLKWFIVPNPMYGHWDYALYHFNYSLNRNAQLHDKLQALDRETSTHSSSSIAQSESGAMPKPNVSVGPATNAALVIAPTTGVSKVAGAISVDVAPKTVEATHRQSTVIRPTEGVSNAKLASFCLTKDGRIAAVVNAQSSNTFHAGGPAPGIFAALASMLSGGNQNKANISADGSSPLSSIAQLRLLDANGKLLAQWPLDFKAEAVNLGPGDTLVLGGDGVLARYDLNGKELSRAESPHLADARKDPEGLKRRAKEVLEQQRSGIKQMVKSLEEQKEKLDKKEASALTDNERQLKPRLDEIIKSYKLRAEQTGDKPVTDQEVDQMVQMLAAQGRKINAVAANEKYIFCTAPASKGYGYSVWRMDLDFGNPQRIADGLSGCCGQMDIQCCGNEVVVAENSRKHVVRYDSDGKQIAVWGKGSRDGEGDTFGSCCNPMNTRAVGDKLYVSDSDGRVRLFTLDGKYESEVGKANVSPGCKSSIVDVSPDGNRVYYIDVNNSAICVLDRIAADAQSRKTPAKRHYRVSHVFAFHATVDLGSRHMVGRLHRFDIAVVCTG